VTLTVNLQPRSWLPAQAEASRLAEDPQGPEFVLLSGGQGAGKTWWLCWEGMRLYFMALQWAQAHGHPTRDVHGLILSPTLNLLKKTILPTLESVLEQAGLQEHEHYTVNRQEGILRFKWGGCIYLFTAEKPELIIGVNVVVAMVDEPGTPKEGEALARVRGRLRGPAPRRLIVAAGTPEDIISRQWFFDFIASPQALQEHGPDGKNDRRVVFARTADNVHITDLEGYIRGQKSVLTKAQQEAYLEGRFVAFNKGRVYGAYIDRDFEAGGHMVPRNHPLLTPPGPGNELLVSLDFNVDPMCGVIGWRVGDAILWADEIRIPNAGEEGVTPIGQWCREALHRWVAEWKGTVAVYGDATEKRLTVAASQTGWDIVHGTLRPVVEASGWDYRPCVWGSNPREIDRVNTVNKAFEDRRILVAEGCVWLRKDLNLVGFKQGTAQIDKDSDKGLTHLSDAMGYGIVQSTGMLSMRKPGERMPDIVTRLEPAFQERCDWGGGEGGTYDGWR
jgi:hypothetical protein